jgi:Tc5 transposase DNA-binding domain/DDE superfamily endonuclease
MDRERKIQKAIEELESGKYKTIRVAAKANEICHVAVTRRRKGAKPAHQAHSSQQACTPAEEQALVDWLKRWSNQNFPIRHETMRVMARHIILNRMNSSRRNTVSAYLTSINWLARFIKRHPELGSLIVKPIEKPRSDACTREIFKKWFDIFNQHMQQYKPIPANIYNIDETGFVLGDGEKMYAIVDKRQKTHRTLKAKKGEFLTVIECASASGSMIPPFVIYKGKYLQSHWFEPGAGQDWMVCTSPKGWTSNELGLKWLESHFEQYTKPSDDTY